MRLGLAAVCGSVVDPMREPHDIILNLPFDNTLIVDTDNTEFWDNCDDLKTVFPGEGPLHMVVFPCTFALGYGATVPSLFATLVDSIDSTDPNVSIAAGEPMPGVAVALRALAHNNFGTIFWERKQMWNTYCQILQKVQGCQHTRFPSNRAD